MDGILVIDKPAGFTSHKVVREIGKHFPGVKIGHSGTLDPMATGVLPICLGKATRLTEYIMEMPKEYQAAVTLGITTDTEDATGEITGRQPVPVFKLEEIEKLLKSFTGDIEQIPPHYSAVKYKGKPLYHWKRQGKEAPRRSRKVTIYEITLIRYSAEFSPHLEFMVRCSKGTYIRTLASEIGEKLGCGAHLSALTRLSVGPYTIKNALSLEKVFALVATGNYDQLFYAMDSAVAHKPKLILKKEDIDNLRCGRTVDASKIINNEPLSSEQIYRIYRENMTFSALAQLDTGGLKPCLKTVKYLEKVNCNADN